MRRKNSARGGKNPPKTDEFGEKVLQCVFAQWRLNKFLVIGSADRGLPGMPVGIASDVILLLAYRYAGWASVFILDGPAFRF